MGLTPKIHILCFVIINSFLYHLFLVRSCFRTLSVILVIRFVFSGEVLAQTEIPGGAGRGGEEESIP